MVTVIKAIVREAKEEAGILVKKNDLHFVQVMHRQEKNEERIDFFFECKKWQGKVRITEVDKCSELRWTKLERLPKKIVPYVKFAIRKYIQGKKLSLFGWTKKA